jgi:hypothetical protein
MIDCDLPSFSSWLAVCSEYSGLNCQSWIDIRSRITIGDPVYLKGNNELCVRLNQSCGKYRLCWREVDFGGILGRRISAICAVRDPYYKMGREIKWRRTGCVGVDSGRIVIGDEKSFPKDICIQDYLNGDLLTHITDGAVILRSGFGDGIYDVWKSIADGKVIGVAMRFIEDGGDE